MPKNIKKWLIKNNNKIIGPFSESEVKKQLKTGNIVPFATVSIPGQEFWGFISSYPEFSSDVNLGTTKLTNTFGTGKSTVAISKDTITKTDPDNEITESTLFQQATGTRIASIDDLTDTDKNNLESEDKQDHTIKEAIYKVVEENKIVPSRSYKKKIKQSHFFTNTTAILMILFLAVFFIKPYIDKTNPVSETTTTIHGMKYFSAGAYKTALKIWQQQHQEKTLKGDGLLWFHILSFQLKNDLQQVEVINNFTQNKNIHIDPEVIQMIKALSYFKKDNVELAKKSLENILAHAQLEEIKEAAFSNSSLIATKTGDCSFFNNKPKYNNNHLNQFSYGFCLLKTKQFQKAKQVLEQITYQPSDYYSEALIGLIYLQMQNNEEPTELIKKLLDSNPYLTEDHYYSVFIDRNIYSWPELLPICQKVYSNYKNNQWAVVLYAYCLNRANNYTLDKQFIKKAIAMDPENVLIKSIHAYINSSMANHQDQFALILGDAIHSNSDAKYTLPHILQARFCEQKTDWECAVQHWKTVLEHRPHSIAALGGLAYSKYNQKYFTEAREYLDRALSKSNQDNYSPLIFVQNSVPTEDITEESNLQ